MPDLQKPPLTLATPVQFLPGVGPSRAEKLGKLGLRTAQDLLFLFPRDYEYPAPPARIDQLSEGKPASFVGTISDAEIASRTPGKSVFAAIVQNDTGAARILFFNQPFRADVLTIGRQVLVSGSPKLNGLRMELVHPKVTLLDDTEESSEPQILPVYPLTEGVRQIEMRRVVGAAVGELGDQLVEVMPSRLRQDAAEMLRAAGIETPEQLCDLRTALGSLHNPRSRSDLADARTRLVFQELLVMQLALAMRRRKLTTDLRAPPLVSSAMIEARIFNRFPFELTGDQRRAVRDVAGDMARQFPMNRLLQGDVGSGKTVVAVFAMMLAVANSHQAVLMTPTEMLARQHYQTLRRMLGDSRVSIGLLCGSLTDRERRDVLERLADGEIDLLVGTQSLVQEGVEFHRLGLCVIDEQHKFGVTQRVALRTGGVDPHYLVMSATPIPRSIAMTLFGDVELSTLREKPPGRAAVRTYLAQDGWIDRWWKFVRARLDEGRQAFVVAPRVVAKSGDSEESEDVASVESVFENLCEGSLSDYRVGLLHGGMPAARKTAAMEDFAAGRTQVLVTTTVIEVGIDVTNATVMTILGAERFGLAQLHQLRGRVARSEHVGHVCVFTDGEGSPEEIERLRVFEQTDNGFELAEADFRMRGPGDVLGREQSGMPPMRIADLSRDGSILAVARELAQRMIDDDPKLEAESLRPLRTQVLRRYGGRLDLGDVA